MLDQIIKNKFMELYGIYNSFTEKLKEISEKYTELETQVIAADKENNQADPTDEIKNLIEELMLNFYLANTLQMDIGKLGYEMIAYYRVAIQAGIQLELTEEQSNGVLEIARDMGALTFVLDKKDGKEKVISKMPNLEETIRNNIKSAREPMIARYIQSIRVDPKYNDPKAAENSGTEVNG